MIQFSKFVEQFRALDLEEFLAEVTVPHLCLAAMPKTEDQASSKFRTVGLSSLALQLHGGKRVLFPLAKKEGNAFASMITLGRARNNDVTVFHPGVSKFHACFRQAGDAWTVSDANSSFGTFLDGTRLAPEKAQPVVAGSRVRLAADEGGQGLDFEFLTPEALYERVQAG